MRKLGLWFAALLLGLSICGGSCTTGRSKDEEEIRALEDRFTAAFRAKDIDAVLNAYAPDAELVVFDLVPPRQYASFSAVDRFEVTDLSITTDGKLAYAHSIQHFVATQKNGSKFDSTVRVTDCYRKIGGKWLITHEHVSVPVDLATGKADLASKP